MTTTYIVVLCVYMVILFTLGVIGYRKSSATEEDFYLAGRGQGMIVTVFTIMATMFSSAAILGIPGAVYREGAGFIIFALNLPVAGAAIFVFGSRIRRIGRKRDFVTPGDMIAGYYGQSALLRVLVALSGALYVLPYVIMQIKAGGLLAQTMFPDAGSAFAYGTTALSAVTVFYVLVGGMRSVAWTDVMQGALLLMGMLVAGVATIVALGGIGGFWATVRELPTDALRLPGATGAFPWSKLFTIVVFASVASIIQPSQWMRMYAARDTMTLKRSSMIFATILPICFLFGIMLVALAGRALYPPVMDAATGKLMPGEGVSAWDQIVPVIINIQLPELMGTLGVVLVAVIFVAVLAASMSTADSNLHALSAVFMRDIYERFIRADASEREKAWVGRLTIVVVMGMALALVHFGSKPESSLAGIMNMIVELMFLAIAFACQLLPLVIDMTLIRRGTRAGATAGLFTGLLVVLLFTPLGGAIFGEGFAGLTKTGKSNLDVGFIGFVFNAIVFAVVSKFTPSVDPAHLKGLAEDMDSGD